MFDGMEYSSSTAECFSNLNSMPKKKKNKNKRRFSDEQIRSLEVMFESETKLEPKRKLELAKELGLQPRQVAIWFQNKRARWKSKHIEKEYSVLLAKYNNLASQFESLKKEKQSLAVQLQKLKNEKTAGKCDDEKSNQSEIKLERAVNNSSSSTEGETTISDHNTKIDLEYCRCLLSDDDSCSMRAGLLELDEENELLKMVDPSADHSSVEDWGSLDSDDLINQPTGSTFQWWDFWSS